MPRPRMAILGASGFVGSTLCERLFGSEEFEFVPYVHSFGNTARLARFPIKLVPLDVMSPGRLQEALAGCDIVVDLTRGLPVQMVAMMKNIVQAARHARVKKVIHLSSIAIYGRYPGPETRDESAAPSPDDDYGLAKWQQDELLFKMHRAGVPAVALCPANIYGPYAPFILRTARQLRDGEVVLVEGGKTPTNNVHVANVVEAILAAARSDAGWGERYFINDRDPVCWRDYFEDMQRILKLDAVLPSAARADVLQALNRPKPTARFRDNFTALLSGEFRQALSHLPLFRRFNTFVYNKFIQCSLEFQDRARARLHRPTVIPKDKLPPDLENRCVTEQLRSVYHSPDKIMTKLGYKHALTYRQGMETVRQWLEFANIA
jgi:nucleoside-diphosphate-sugar epimerase